MDNIGPLPSTPGSGLVMSIGGVLPVKSLAQMQADERAQAEATNQQAYITSLAGHIRTKWEQMRTAKMQTVEPRLLQCLRQRRGEYDPERLQLIKEQGGSDIYMMLSSNKARAASSWIRDVMTDPEGMALPFSIRPTPVPTLSPDKVNAAYMTMRQELDMVMGLGVMPSSEEIAEFVEARHEMLMNEQMEEAREASDRMQQKMNDQLIEGECREEFNKFIDDLVTFPFAMMKGPVIRRRPTFKWVPGPGGFQLQIGEEDLPTWARVDPFMIYWSADAEGPRDGELIERHRLSRASLASMRGVDGYNSAAIDQVLEAYGSGGLHEWLWVDAAKAVAEGKHLSSAMMNSDGLIDALQYWGSVQGTVLIDWGIDASQVADPLAEYSIEAWLIGGWVIKAVINPDPLQRKPYYKASYEEIPGAWMGNSPMDLIRDCQDVCNASARALVNNMGISSGPQVWVNIDRIPTGEKITKLYPWKIHQTTSDPLGSTAPPLDFFQPSSLAGELMAVYERFSVLADEYSGVPRYMTGDSPAGGAGRTASGMSMLMNNAGKAIKQVIANVDRNVIEPLVERLWFYNMKYVDDPELKGDVKVSARGSTALMMKEAAAQRRNELLQIALTSPVAQQIMGIEGTAHLLREQVKTLDMNADKIVAPPEVIKARMMVQNAQMAIAAQQQAQQPDEQLDVQRGPNGEMTGMSVKRKQPSRPQQPPRSGQELTNGAPVTDAFGPIAGVGS